MKTFVTTLNSLHTYNPLSAMIHHLGCLHRITFPYNFLKENTIKKSLHPALSALFVPFQHSLLSPRWITWFHFWR